MIGHIIDFQLWNIVYKGGINLRVSERFSGSKISVCSIRYKWKSIYDTSKRINITYDKSALSL